MLQLGRISKNAFCEISHFTDFLGCQPLQKDWTTLELLEVIHETVTLTKFFRKNATIVNFKKNVFCLILLLILARILIFSS